ncbi:MAG: hypothetical protein GEU90_13070 [Gemmatimonas sp.]|nr:hypothetical protein [Gemmatimonas sp.]
MKFQGMEDRLNPVPREGIDETTLGGYTEVHGRAPGFEALDGSAYTVAIEVERPDREGDPYAAYLVFVRWSGTGSAIMGHLETGDLASGATETEVRQRLESMPLARAKEILEETITRKQSEDF